MSRWGALFAELSAKDTTDTIDKTPKEGAAALHFVDCVDCVPTGAGECEAWQAAAPDSEPMDHDAAERAAMAAHYAAGTGASIYRPDQPDALRDGLLAGALQRPPAWSDPALIPPPGAWCSCCGRFDRKGGRWWTSAPNPDGWACVTCHPPDHLSTDAVRVMVT